MNKNVIILIARISISEHYNIVLLWWNVEFSNVSLKSKFDQTAPSVSKHYWYYRFNSVMCFTLRCLIQFVDVMCVHFLHKMPTNSIYVQQLWQTSNDRLVPIVVHEKKSQAWETNTLFSLSIHFTNCRPNVQIYLFIILLDGCYLTGGKRCR